MRLQKLGHEIKAISESCRIVAETLDLLEKMVKPGLATVELESAAVRHIKKRGGSPSFKGYLGFPGAICVSIDEEIVHGIPGRRRLRNGSIVSIDVGVFKNGFHGDAALTVPVGNIDEDVQRLLDVTEAALYAGIAEARPGKRMGDVSAAVQDTVEREGFSVVRELVGHGIGRKLHEEPKIPNFGYPGSGLRLKDGMTLAIEPMVNQGTFRIKVLDDQWTIVTEDGKPSAHFEHTVLVTRGHPELLTGRS